MKLSWIFSLTGSLGVHLELYLVNHVTYIWAVPETASPPDVCSRYNQSVFVQDDSAPTGECYAVKCAEIIAFALSSCPLDLPHMCSATRWWPESCDRWLCCTSHTWTQSTKRLDILFKYSSIIFYGHKLAVILTIEQTQMVQFFCVQTFQLFLLMRFILVWMNWCCSCRPCCFFPF